jgi:arsenite methyltransferase
MSTTEDTLREEVRARYAETAVRLAEGGACGCENESCCGDPATASFGNALYSDADRGELPDAAVLASLGCGNPTAVAELSEGETVLDLGSGGGIDVILSARRVGPTGLAYGLDMTDEMLALAQRNAAEAGARNAIFLKGEIENVPLPADSIDVAISNCVINLSTDKPAVFAELGRVVRPGGRIGISDVVAENRLSRAERAERGSFVGCVAGALSEAEYEAGLEAAGFADVRVTFTHEVADGLHGAIVQARKPEAGVARPLPVVSSGREPSAAGCC